MFAPLFFGALLGLTALFTVRLIEERRGARFASSFRERLDQYTLAFKRQCLRVELFLEQMPRLASFALRALTVITMRRFARMTEGLSRAAHSAADMVSYKHRHERTETRSHFLKQVSRKTEDETHSNS